MMRARFVAKVALWAVGFVALAGVLPAADGQVVNQTSGKPQSGATVTLYKLTNEGPEAVQSVKTDAAGKFQIEQSVAGPQMLQVAYQDVVYTKMIPPGRPSTGVEIPVFESTSKPTSVKTTNHMMLLEPAGDKLSVRESYFLDNSGRTTWNDPAGGTLRFATAAAPVAEIEVNATAPGSVPVKRVATPAKDGKGYFLDFAIKPGETRIDLSYTLPYQDPLPYKLAFLLPAEKRMVAAPNGVTLAGKGLVDKGREPNTQASIFEVEGTALDITISGAGELPGGGQQPETEGPGIEEARAHVMRRMPWLVGLAFGILAIGFYLLYRAPNPAPAEKK